jgi:hypothetical protein
MSGPLDLNWALISGRTGRANILNKILSVVQTTHGAAAGSCGITQRNAASRACSVNDPFNFNVFDYNIGRAATCAV